MAGVDDWLYQRPSQTAQVAPKKKRSLGTTLLPAAGAIGAGLIAAPLTGGLSLAGTIAALAAAGAIGGGLGEFGAQRFSNEKTDIGKIGKEAAISGLFAGGGAALGGLRGARAAHAAGLTGKAFQGGSQVGRAASGVASGTMRAKDVGRLATEGVFKNVDKAAHVFSKASPAVSKTAGFKSISKAFEAGDPAKGYQIWKGLPAKDLGKRHFAEAFSPKGMFRELAEGKGLEVIAPGGKIVNQAAAKVTGKAAPKSLVTAIPKAPTVAEGNIVAAGQRLAGKNAADRTGRLAVRATLGIDDIVAPGKTTPTTILKADKMLNEALKSGFKGTPRQMQYQVAAQKKFLDESANKILSQSTKTTSAKALQDQARREIAAKLPLQIEGVPVKQELARSLNQLGKGQVTAKKLYAFKNSLPVNNAFRKINAGGSLTAKETADLALWSQADDWITKLAPNAKEVTTRSSNLYGISQGLAKMTASAGEPGNISQIGIRALSPTLRKGEGFVGRKLIQAGALAEKARPVTGPLAANLKRQAIPAYLASAQQNEGPPITNALQEQGMVSGFQGTNPNLAGGAPGAGLGTGGLAETISGMGAGGTQQMAQPQQSPYPLANAISDIQRDPKHAKEYMAYYDFVNSALEAQGEGGLTTDQKNKQAKAASLQQSVGVLLNNYQTAGGGQSLVGGGRSILGRTPGVRSLGLDPAAQNYEDQRKALIAPLARTISGEVGVLTDRDIARAEGLLPRLSDPPQVAQKKIEDLMFLIQQAGGGGGELESQLANAGYTQGGGF